MVNEICWREILQNLWDTNERANAYITEFQMQEDESHSKHIWANNICEDPKLWEK